MNQQQLSTINRNAWNDSAYEAWVKKYGSPNAAAADIKVDPRFTARRILPHLSSIEGQKIANPLGSHGRVATALALLGANVSVFDISASNAKYGAALAEAANVKLNYIVGDFLEETVSCEQMFDAAVMELGVLHYFASLEAFVGALKHIVRPGGLIVLNEFHPLMKKSLSVSSGKLEMAGDYFSTAHEQAATPYEPILGQHVPACLIRRWNLAEIVSAFFDPDLELQHFAEHPSSECAHLPGTFSLVVRRTK